MPNKQQSGFTAIEIILVVALMAIIGATGYFAYQRFQTASTVEVSPSPTMDSAQRALKVGEWRVQLPTMDELDGLTLGTPAPSSYNPADSNVAIYAPELDAQWTCAAVDGRKGLIGSISRTSDARRSGPYEPLAEKKLGNVTFGFEATETSNCTTDPAYKALVTNFRSAFQKLETY